MESIVREKLSELMNEIKFSWIFLLLRLIRKLIIKKISVLINKIITLKTLTNNSYIHYLFWDIKYFLLNMYICMNSF